MAVGNRPTDLPLLRDARPERSEDTDVRDYRSRARHAERMILLSRWGRDGVKGH